MICDGEKLQSFTVVYPIPKRSGKYRGLTVHAMGALVPTVAHIAHSLCDAQDDEIRLFAFVDDGVETAAARAELAKLANFELTAEELFQTSNLVLVEKPLHSSD